MGQTQPILYESSNDFVDATLIYMFVDDVQSQVIGAPQHLFDIWKKEFILPLPGLGRTSSGL